MRCYRHPGCSVLLTLDMAPVDEELIEWCFELPAATPQMSSVDATALARQHVRLADRWQVQRGGSSASGGKRAAPSRG